MSIFWIGVIVGENCFLISRKSRNYFLLLEWEPSEVNLLLVF